MRGVARAKAVPMKVNKPKQKADNEQLTERNLAKATNPTKRKLKMPKKETEKKEKTTKKKKFLTGFIDRTNQEANRGQAWVFPSPLK